MNSFYITKEGYLYFPLLVDKNGLQELVDETPRATQKNLIHKTAGKEFIRGIFLPTYLEDLSTMPPKEREELRRKVLKECSVDSATSNKTMNALGMILNEALPYFTDCPRPQEVDEAFKGINTRVLDYCSKNITIPQNVKRHASELGEDEESKLEIQLKNLRRKKTDIKFTDKVYEENLDKKLNVLREKVIIRQETQRLEEQIRQSSKQRKKSVQNKTYNAVIDYLLSDGARFEMNNLFFETKGGVNSQIQFVVGLQTGEYVLQGFQGGDTKLYHFKNVELGVTITPHSEEISDNPVKGPYPHPFLSGGNGSICLGGQQFFSKLTSQNLIANLEKLYQTMTQGYYPSSSLHPYGALNAGHGQKVISPNDPRIRNGELIITNKGLVESGSNRRTEKLSDYGL